MFREQGNGKSLLRSGGELLYALRRAGEVWR